MPIGIMGGTFNPIHYGHLRTAAEVADRFGLEKVLFIPASLPPHKGNREVVSAKHRRGMVELGIREDRRFTLSLTEIEREGTSYTVDTLELLRRDPYPREFFFIMGIDSFCEISTWKDARKCFFLTNFVVTTRPGFLTGEIIQVFQHPVLKGLDFVETDKGRALGCRSLKASDSSYGIFVLETKPVPVSSTEIRKKINKGVSVSNYLPEAVEKYIMNKGIYQG